MNDQRPHAGSKTGGAGPPARRGGGYGVPAASGPAAARFGIVLLLLLGTFILMTAARGGSWNVALTTALQATTLIAALHAAGTGPLLTRAAVAVSIISVVGAVISVVGAVIEAVTGDAGQRNSYFLVDVLLVGTAPAAITAGIVRRRRLDVQSVMGALCVYVLLGMFWSFVYAAISALGSGPFFAQTTHPDTSDFTYFSFVTLTTTGYGDLTALARLGRAMAVLDALFGQLYLVTVVALLVGNLGPRRDR